MQRDNILGVMEEVEISTSFFMVEFCSFILYIYL